MSLEQRVQTSVTAHTSAVAARADLAAYRLLNERRLTELIIERALMPDDDFRRYSVRLAALADSAHARWSRSECAVQAIAAATGVSRAVAQDLLRFVAARSALETEDGKRLMDGEIAGSPFGQAVLEGAFAGAVTARLPKPAQATIVRRALDAATRAAASIAVDAETVTAAVERLGALRRTRPAPSLSRAGQTSAPTFSVLLVPPATRSQTSAAVYVTRVADAIQALATSAGPYAANHPPAIANRPAVVFDLAALSGRDAIDGIGTRMRLQADIEALARAASAGGVRLIADAPRERDLETVFDTIVSARNAPALATYDGLGLTIDAASRRALALIRALRLAARDAGRIIPVRLVGGVHLAQELGDARDQALADYPILTSDERISVSMIACTRLLAEARHELSATVAARDAATQAAAEVALTPAGLGGVARVLVDTGHTHTSQSPAALATWTDYELEFWVGDVAAGLARIARTVEAKALLSALARANLTLGAAPLPSSSEVDPSSEIDPIRRLAASPSRGFGDPSGPGRSLLPPNLTARGYARLAVTDWPRFGEARADTETDQDLTVVRPRRISADGVEASRKHSVRTAERASIPVLPTDPATNLCDPCDRFSALITLYPLAGDAAPSAVDIACASAASWDRTSRVRRHECLAAALKSAALSALDLAHLMSRLTGQMAPAANVAARTAIDRARLALATVEQAAFVAEGEAERLRAAGPTVILSDGKAGFDRLTAALVTCLALGNSVILSSEGPEAVLIDWLAVHLEACGLPQDVVVMAPAADRVGLMRHRLIEDPRIVRAVLVGAPEFVGETLSAASPARRGSLVAVPWQAPPVFAVIDASCAPAEVAHHIFHGLRPAVPSPHGLIRKVIISDSIADRVIATLRDHVASVKLGSPFDGDVDWGPLSGRLMLTEALACRQKLSKGALASCEADPADDVGPGLFCGPAMYEFAIDALADLEISGPTVVLGRCRDDHLEERLEAVVERTLQTHGRRDAPCEITVFSHAAERWRVFASTRLRGGVDLYRTPPSPLAPPFSSRWHDCPNLSAVPELREVRSMVRDIESLIVRMSTRQILI
ncbi:MAG: proline dehydrogenase family protein [Hyphomicrobiaceae bacterium]